MYARGDIPQNLNEQNNVKVLKFIAQIRQT